MASNMTFGVDKLSALKAGAGANLGAFAEQKPPKRRRDFVPPQSAQCDQRVTGAVSEKCRDVSPHGNEEIEALLVDHLAACLVADYLERSTSMVASPSGTDHDREAA